MIWQLNPYAIPLQISAIISVIIAYSSWHRVTIPGRRAFALFMTSLAIWMFGYSLELTFIPTNPENPLFPRIEYLGIATSAPLWVIFLLRYAGFKRWASRQLTILLFIIPVATIFVVWFRNDIFWESITLVENGPYTLLSFVHGFWFNVIHTPYSYLLYGSSIFLLIYIAWRSPRLNRTQGALLLIGFLIPLVSNVLYVVGGVSFFPGLDLTPFVLASIGLVVAWVIFQFRLLESVPIASQAVVQGMPDAVIMLDKRNWIVELNPSAQKILNQDPLNVIGMPVEQVIPASWLRKVRSIQPEQEAVIEVEKENGAARAYFDMQVAPLYDRRQRLMGRLLVLRDVTANKQAMAEIFASQQRLQTVVSSAPMAIFACDTDGLIHTVVGDEVSNLEVDPKTLIGHSAFTTFQSFPDIVANLRQALAGTILTTEFTFNDYIYAVWYKPAENASGEIVGVIVVVLNITERKRTEAALQASQRLESIGVLAGGIAHDFNNLLASVMGHASIAREALGEQHTAVSHIDLALDGVERASHLTRQLLAYAGKGTFEQKALDLNELLIANVELLQATFADRVHLFLALSAKPATIKGDNGQVQQVIMNLVINAIESIETPPGRVTIGTELIDVNATMDLTKWHGGEALAKGKYVLLKVADNGGGIAEETVSRIFEPFFTTKPMGRGLGLAATLGIIKSHGGGLHIESTVGAGSTFSVLFPYVLEAVPETAVSLPIRALTHAQTVLIIDDEASVRRMLHDMLVTQGIHILEAKNGRHALTIFEQHKAEIDLVFLDMQMPIMDGAETFRHLRQLLPNLKVIITSGYSESEAMTLMAQDEQVDFIQKPFRMKQLLAKMQGLLAKASD